MNKLIPVKTKYIMPPGNSDTVCVAIWIQVSSEKHLLRTIEALIPKLPFETVLPCGESYALGSIYELPPTDLPCSCGNPNHWFVRYSILPELDWQKEAEEE